MTNELGGKVALVTGGSRGIGKWISIELARHGAFVTVNYAHQRSFAEETVGKIRTFGGKATPFLADVTDEQEVCRLVRAIEDREGKPVAILVNNATGPQPELSIEESKWTDYKDQLAFFVKAPLLLVKAVIPKMKQKQEGCIINIGSEVVSEGRGTFASYVTAKSAMIGMTRSWASELGPYGIRVNLISPGWIPVERHSNVSPASLDAYRQKVPLRKLGEPADIANAVVFLASESAKFITGQCLAVDGGKNFGI